MLGLEQQIFRQLEKAKNTLIIFPSDGNGDAMASALGLFLFLKKAGKEVSLASPEKDTKLSALSFLPAFASIQNHLNNLRRFIVSLNISEAKVSQIKYTVDGNQLNFIISPASGWFQPKDVTTQAGEFKYDLIIVLGTTDLESLGKLYDDNVEFFYKTTIINIDNRPSNEEFGQINFVDLNAAAIGEIIFYLLKNWQENNITEESATCLLAGIIQATKNFKTPNLNPRTLLSASELITRGAEREKIINHLYRSRNINSLKLWGNLLNGLQVEKNNQLLWSKLSPNNLALNKETDISDGLDTIVDELIVGLPNAKLMVIFYEKSPQETKVILYSLKNINAMECLKEYEPQGLAQRAEAIINKNLETSINLVLDNLRKTLDKINS